MNPLKLTSLFVAIALVSAASSRLSGQTTTIDFTTIPQGTTVSTGTDTTFNTEPTLGTFQPAVAGFGGLTNYPSNSFSAPNQYLVVNFTRSVGNLSFVFNNQGNNSFNNGGTTYTAFNSSGTAIQTGNLSAATNTTFTINPTGVSELLFNSNFGNSWFFDLNSLTFNVSGLTLTGLTPNQSTIANNLNGTAVGGNGNLVTAINTAVNGNPNAEAAYLNQLSPQAFGQFTSSTAFNNAVFETQAMDNYLAGQRDQNGNFLAGNGQIDSSGLTMNDPSYASGLATVHSRLMAWNPAPFDGTISDVANPLLGGVDMKDSKDMKSMHEAPTYSDPWNFFVRGNVILAQGFSQDNVSHFDDNTESVTLGTDYRITPNFLVGLTAGYGHTDATLDDNGSSATVDSYSPGFYASYADKGWYANLSGNYTHDAFTQDRVIGFLGQTAHSAPEGNQGTANLDGGYDFHHGAWTFGPLAGVQYTHLTVDGYDESGSIADLTVNDQQSDSLRSRVGGRVQFAYSHYGMVFTPHLDASWQHEFMDQSRGITSQFDGAGLGSFAVQTTNPSRDSALVDVGLDVAFNRTITGFAEYEVQAGQENYFGQSVQGGVKVGF